MPPPQKLGPAFELAAEIVSRQLDRVRSRMTPSGPNTVADNLP